jgi:hypothetical protein
MRIADWGWFRHYLIGMLMRQSRQNPHSALRNPQ